MSMPKITIEKTVYKCDNCGTERPLYNFREIHYPVAETHHPFMGGGLAGVGRATVYLCKHDCAKVSVIRKCDFCNSHAERNPDSAA